MDHEGLRHLLTWTQSGVVARRQLINFGATHGDIERMLRRRDLARVHPGVFVNHNGPLTAPQREWGAVLAAWPAALSHQSAMPGGQPGEQIHVAIAHGRKLQPIRGITFHRTTDLDNRVIWNSAPPRVRPAHAVIDVMSACTDVASMFSALSSAAQTREVWADSLRDALTSRAKVSRRRLIAGMVDDLADGANSVLERRWLRLERAHGLPVGGRQVRANSAGRLVIRDVLYPVAQLIVELDGLAWHASARARNRDSARDLAAAADEGLQTLRLTYGQVFDAGCQTAALVGAILQRSGWTGAPKPCHQCR